MSVRCRGVCPSICISELLSWSSMRCAIGWAAFEECHSSINPLYRGPHCWTLPNKYGLCKRELRFEEDMLMCPCWDMSECLHLCLLCEGECVWRGHKAVYGSTATVWQVYHSIIKGHIITYNPACMTITGGKAGPLREACCVLHTLSPLSFTSFFICCILKK